MSFEERMMQLESRYVYVLEQFAMLNQRWKELMMEIMIEREKQTEAE
jgi:hypothetical protein